MIRKLAMCKLLCLCVVVVVLVAFVLTACGSDVNYSYGEHYQDR